MVKTIYLNQYREKLYLDRSVPTLDPDDPAARIKWRMDQIRDEPFIPYVRMLRYDLPHLEPTTDLDAIVRSMKPTYDVTTWEAQYCIEKGIPLLSEFEFLKHYPSIQWKLLNIAKLKKGNPRKHQETVDKLDRHFGNL